MIQIIHQDSSEGRYAYQLSGMKTVDLRQDFALLWEKLIDHVAAHRIHGTWNRLLFECWVDQGYVLAYPQQRGESPDKRYPEATVGLDYLASVIEKAGDAIRDERIEGLFNIAYIDVRDAIRG